MLEEVFYTFTKERGLSVIRRNETLVAGMPGTVVVYKKIASWESLTAGKSQEYAYVGMHDPQQGNFLRVAIVQPCLRDYLTMLLHHDDPFTYYSLRRHFEIYLDVPFDQSALHQVEFTGLHNHDFMAVLDCFHPQQ